MTHKQTEKNSNFLTSLKHALHGILTVIQEERNMKAHLCIAFLAIIISFFSKLSALEWCILLCIFIVFLMEILNTVVENLVDLLVKKEYHIEAKKAKDIAAGGVLLSAGFTVIIAIIIILPKWIHF